MIYFLKGVCFLIFVLLIMCIDVVFDVMIVFMIFVKDVDYMVVVVEFIQGIVGFCFVNFD